MAAPRYFLQENGLRTGPHSLLVLKQKAEIRVITPETSIAPEDEPDRWSPIRESQVLAEELFPPRPGYGLTANRPVAHVNSPAESSVPTVDEMLRNNLARQKTAEGELLKPLPSRSNRRLKDFLFTVAAGAVASMIPWLFVNVTIGHIFLSAAATAFVAICAAWVFYGVMDRY